MTMLTWRRDTLSRRDLAEALDLDLLHPELTEDEIREGCGQARDNGLGSVYLHPWWLHIGSGSCLGGTSSCGVVGFPFGLGPSRVKALEAEWCAYRATGVAMVMNTAALRAGRTDLTSKQIGTVLRACNEHRVRLRVMVEFCVLNSHEQQLACDLCRHYDLSALQLGTGFGRREPTVREVQLVSANVNPGVGVIVTDNNVVTLADALSYFHAGATRICTREAVRIVNELPDGI